MKFNMILVVAGEDYKNIEIVIENSNKYIAPDMIYIITPLECLNKNIYIKNKYQNVNLINENEILPIEQVSFDSIALPGFPNRKYWYYQQFLKMAFSYSKYCNHEHYLIWDADTIPLNKINFISNTEQIYLTTSNSEYHGEYFNNIKKIFKDINIYEKSFISQHLYVNINHMKEIIEHLGSIENHNWTNNLLSQLSGNSISLFSEYETYCNYVLNKYPDQYKIIKRKWFRRGAFIVKGIGNIDNLSEYYDYIAIEKTDKSIIKKIFFFFYYLWTRNKRI
jgi:hypothetical protein